ncbi:hypothetical protein BZA77DRAFT_31747 [Pyronema omphalodes]|nr:hypothetical protein BZA77DRAFT_31747 [Pyronema omphalodes]
MLISGAYSDLTIKVGSETFNVHKAVLRVRTKFFEMATREGGFLESKNNTVIIEEHSAHAVWRFLTYCYTGDYRNDKYEGISEDDDEMYVQHARVHALADMLDIPDLKLFATEKLKIQLKSWVTISFIHCVQEIYTMTNAPDLGLRDALLSAADTNIHILLGTPFFQEELQGYGEFLVALLVKIRLRISSSVVSKSQLKGGRLY